ncbi:D-alanyl-D-alanine carboxypeptidase [Serratia ureilytica]
MVRDAESGTVLYQAHAEQRLAPASNMKMFTSLAAFGVLGADYRFETRLLTTGEQRGDTLRGSLSAGQRRSDAAPGRSRHLRRHAGAAWHSPYPWAADPGCQRVRSNAIRRRLELGR